MGLEHKAFLFDYAAFDLELRPILEKALSDGNGSKLVEFIDRNIVSLSDPYEGEPLTADWSQLLETQDAHQYGDFALTKFYDPTQDLGFGRSWEAVEAAAVHLLGDAQPVLGRTIGPTGNVFDPGKAGSYFQSEDAVKENRRRLLAAMESSGQAREDVHALDGLLRTAVDAGRGLYVTF
jgi:hypothetical protein